MTFSILEKSKFLNMELGKIELLESFLPRMKTSSPFINLLESILISTNLPREAATTALFNALF